MCIHPFQGDSIFRRHRIPIITRCLASSLQGILWECPPFPPFAYLMTSNWNFLGPAGPQLKSPPTSYGPPTLSWPKSTVGHENAPDSLPAPSRHWRSSKGRMSRSPRTSSPTSRSEEHTSELQSLRHL